jgi:hypothetical protein
MEVAILVLASIGTVGALVEYGVKVCAERRLQLSAASEVDTRVSKLFVELMWLAHARGEGCLSEKCVEKLFEEGAITKEDFGAPEKVREKLASCAINLPVGAASQDAAILSIGVLGRRYKILSEGAREGLNSLKDGIPQKAQQIDKALALLDS